MIVLNEQQVSFILDDIRRNGIEAEELQLNLLDHICCIIENEMQPGQDFEVFYRMVIPRFFRRDLGEIQEEANLLLTFKHYYAMKKVMLISGTFAATGVVTGAIFKVMRWPGASPIFLLSVLALSFIFLPILFLLKTKEIKEKREKITLGIATLFGMFVSLAALFKVMHWPGGAPLGLLALGTLVFVFLPVYFFGGIRNPETKMNTIVSSVLILFAGGLLFLMTSLRPSQQMHYTYASSVQDAESLYASATQQNALKYALAEKDSAKPQAQLAQLKMSCDAVCAKIEAAKNELSSLASEGLEPKPAYQTLLADNVGNYELPTNVLFDHNGVPNASLEGIKNEVEELRVLLKEKFPKAGVSLIHENGGNPGNAEEKTSWERSKFYHVPFELVMLNFTQLELEVRMAENQCL